MFTATLTTQLGPHGMSSIFLWHLMATDQMTKLQNLALICHQSVLAPCACPTMALQVELFIFLIQSLFNGKCAKLNNNKRCFAPDLA